MADQPAFTDRDHHKAAPVPATPRPSIYDLRQPALDDPFGELFDRHAPLPPGERAQQELIELYLQNGGADSAAFGDSRFSNESGGALLRTGFDDVTLLELTDTWLEVTDAECIVDELQRLRYTLEPGLAPDASWDDLVDGARADAQAVIDRDGAFRMTENQACSPAGSDSRQRDAAALGRDLTH